MPLSRKVSAKLAEIVQSKGGNIISGRIENQKSLLTLKCKAGHTFTQTINKLVYANSWCALCNSLARRATELKELQELASSKRGKLLSDTYISVHDKYLWQCAENHQWWAPAYCVKNGTWCPSCKEGLGERLCRTIFEQIFKKSFVKVRPEWLAVGGSRLELDGYCEELKLAFEYQGNQHFDFRPFKVISNGRRNFEDFIKSQKRDEQKKQKCHEQGVALIVIPETNLSDLEGFKQRIIQELKQENIEVDASQKVDYSSAFLSRNFEKLNTLKKIAQSRGGECLAENFIDSETPLPFVCSNGHKWQAVAYDIQRGVWCRECVRPRINLERVKAIAAQRGGKCLSISCVNKNSVVKLQCNNDHIWETRAINITSGYWCPACSRSR